MLLTATVMILNTSLPTQSTTSSLNHSSSTSNHQHTHHHTHQHHHERLSPGNQLLGLRHGMHSKMPQANPHHLMIQPPSMGHHGPLGKTVLRSNSISSKRFVMFRSSNDGKQFFGPAESSRRTSCREYAKPKCAPHPYKFPDADAIASYYSDKSAASRT